MVWPLHRVPKAGCSRGCGQLIVWRSWSLQQWMSCKAETPGDRMSQTATYHTTVTWKGGHWGHIAMGNGPEMDFSAHPMPMAMPGCSPEDAFVAAANTAL